jgi:multidrug efflux pump subunit AcrA (membrane-fusion protein)
MRKSIAMILLTTILIGTGCGAMPPVDTVVKPRPVTTITAAASEKTNLYRVVGNAEPAEITRIGPKTGGLVLSIAGGGRTKSCGGRLAGNIGHFWSR